MAVDTSTGAAINSFAGFFLVRDGNKWRHIGEDGLLKLYAELALTTFSTYKIHDYLLT